jgi:hypothetical protein
MYMNLETMNHDQAVSSHAPERYLLGELDPEERDAFEGHYFDCAACFDEIKKGSQFLSYSREVLDPEPEKGRLAAFLGDLRRPAPAFVSAALLLALGIGTYQQVQIADARHPKIEASFFVPNDVKGAAKTISVSRKSQLSLSADFTPNSQFTSYRAQIVAESGQIEYTLPVTTNQTGYTLTIGLPASALGAGKHSLVIQGLSRDGSPTEVGHGSFDLQFVN